jgi:hypothetical protein
MTYEQAVARAFLRVLYIRDYDGPRNKKADYAEKTYALRRLRVRAGLVP